MKFKALLACAVLALTVSACRKKPGPAPVPPAEAPAETRLKPDGTPDLGNAPEMAASNASVLTMGLQHFISKHGRIPNSVEELLAAKSIAIIPPPPAGYKYVIDANAKRVVAVRQ